jgi:hypothetical protein
MCKSIEAEDENIIYITTYNKMTNPCLNRRLCHAWNFLQRKHQERIRYLKEASEGFGY